MISMTMSTREFRNQHWKEWQTCVETMVRFPYLAGEKSASSLRNQLIVGGLESYYRAWRQRDYAILLKKKARSGLDGWSFGELSRMADAALWDLFDTGSWLVFDDLGLVFQIDEFMAWAKGLFRASPSKSFSDLSGEEKAQLMLWWLVKLLSDYKWILPKVEARKEEVDMLDLPDMESLDALREEE